MMNWMTSISFNKMTNLQEELRNVVYAMMVQIIPNIVFLFFFIMFMMDIENYYDTKFTAGYVPHLVLAYYLQIARNFINNLINEMLTWMEIAYQDAYDFILAYINPVVWYNWLLVQLAEVWFWIQTLFLSQEEVDRLAAERRLKEK